MSQAHSMHHRRHRARGQHRHGKVLNLAESWQQDEAGHESQVYGYTPHCDVKELEGAYEVRLDLPGLKKEEIKIEADENKIIVAGERREDTPNENERHLSQECHVGPFMRTITFPISIDADNVKAKYLEGVLILDVPKVSPSQLRVVSIQ